MTARAAALVEPFSTASCSRARLFCFVSPFRYSLDLSPVTI
jgi:hypothetical protein